MECDILASSARSSLLDGIGQSSHYGVKESIECDIVASDTKSASRTKSTDSPPPVSSNVLNKDPVWIVVLCTLVACMASLLNGMMLGFSSPALTQLRFNVSEEYRISDKDIKFSLFASLSLVGAMFGSLVAWPVSDVLGRKPSLMLSGVPAIIGWLLLALAHLVLQPNAFYGILLTGRFFTGLFYGWSSFCVSVYISEIASAKLKGLFGNCNQLFVTIGIFLSYFFGIEYKKSDGTYFSVKYWQIALIAVAIVVLFEFFMLFTYESPRWLLSKHRERKAIQALKGLRGPNFQITKELEQMKGSLQQTYSLMEQLRQFCHRSVIVPFLLVVMLLFYESGIYAFLFYASHIFLEAGLSQRHVNLISTVAIGAIQIIATLASVVVVDCLGRKVLLTVSSAGMALSGLVLGVYFYIYDNVCESCLVGELTCNFNTLNDTVHKYFPCNTTHFGYLAIACIVVLIISFSLGLGPIPWTSLSELMPNHVRTLAGSFATIINWIIDFLVTFGFKFYSRPPINNDGACWIFSLVMFSAIFMIILFLPETKGRSLEAIQEHFEQGHILAISCKQKRSYRKSIAEMATPTTSSCTESNYQQ